MREQSGFAGQLTLGTEKRVRVCVWCALLGDRDTKGVAACISGLIQTPVFLGGNVIEYSEKSRSVDGCFYRWHRDAKQLQVRAMCSACVLTAEAVIA